MTPNGRYDEFDAETYAYLGMRDERTSDNGKKAYIQRSDLASYAVVDNLAGYAVVDKVKQRP